MAVVLLPRSTASIESINALPESTTATPRCTHTDVPEFQRPSHAQLAPCFPQWSWMGLPIGVLWWSLLAAAALVALLQRLYGVQPPRPEKAPQPRLWFQLPPEERYPYMELLDITPADIQACSRPVEGSKGGGSSEGPLFRVHILEPHKLLPHISQLKQPDCRCNLSSPLVWPHIKKKRGMDGSRTTQHWAYQHAGQWWLTQALRNSSLVQLVERPEQADLVYLDLYCYIMWIYSFQHPFGDHKQPSPNDYLALIMQHIQDSERFKRKMGADFVIFRTHPAFPEEFAQPQKMCGMLRNVYWMVAERQMLCSTDQVGVHTNRAVLVPYNAVNDLILKPIERKQRTIFLFYRGACASEEKKKQFRYSSGKLLRRYLVEGVQGLPRDLPGLDLGKRTRVACSCDICKKHLDHEETMRLLAKSLFCPVIPGDTQSSRRVSEVILSGCIPVFFGPPYHTMPLAGLVDYRSFSVFIRFRNTEKWVLKRQDPGGGWNDKSVLEAWMPDLNISDMEHSVASIEEAYRYLQSIPANEVERMQTALSRERYKLLYSPPPGADTSELGELLVQKMCQRAMAVRRLPQQHRQRVIRSQAGASSSSMLGHRG